ncbi:MAG TPA: cytochrome c peroxidase [Saprospiraceae bacterium]|nr:cytochrome c peroxidase [Saprospiraceae bacterium]HMQ83243.1 cytochrome c peroxidase [Saprospiraceae bacterium]
MPSLKITSVFFLLVVILLQACISDDDSSVPSPEKSELDQQLEQVLVENAPGNGLAHFRFPASEDFNRIPQDPKNWLSAEKVALGRLLFHETGLAIKPKQNAGLGTYSCASCHFASAGFQAGRFQGIGEGGTGFGVNGEGRDADATYSVNDLDVQPIRSPSAMNGAYQEVMLWNGQFGATGMNLGTENAWAPNTPIFNNYLGFQGLETQAIAGLTVHRLDMDTAWLESTGYKALFDAAFPDVPAEERYTKITSGLAIAAYERTLFANEAPFQAWLAGDYDAMSAAEKEGALLFFGKAGCNSCHTGPALNSMAFYALGMKDLFDCDEPTFLTAVDSPADLGRGGFTGRPEDNYKFKVPQLYNLKDSPFFGHGGTFRSVRDVVAYKNAAVAENPDVPAHYLASSFVSLGLTETEIDAITLFLENALYDPNLKRYVPESLPSGNCFPNNDALSRQQLGCE